MYTNPSIRAICFSSFSHTSILLDGLARESLCHVIFGDGTLLFVNIQRVSRTSKWLTESQILIQKGEGETIQQQQNIRKHKSS